MLSTLCEPLNYTITELRTFVFQRYTSAINYRKQNNFIVVVWGRCRSMAMPPSVGQTWSETFSSANAKNKNIKYQEDRNLITKNCRSASAEIFWRCSKPGGDIIKSFWEWEISVWHEHGRYQSSQWLALKLRQIQRAMPLCVRVQCKCVIYDGSNACLVSKWCLRITHDMTATHVVHTHITHSIDT